MTTPQAQPQTIFSDLIEAAQAIERGMSRALKADDPRLLAIIDRCQSLMKADAHMGSIAQAHALHLTGDMDAVDYWLDNAARFGSSQVLDHAGVLLAGNIGCMSVAAQRFPKIAKIETGNLSSAASIGTYIGALSDAAAAFKALELAHLEPAHPESKVVNMNAIAVLERHNVTEQQFQAILDLGGEVVRRHGLWSVKMPLLRAFDSEDHSCLLYQLQLAVSPERAAELTDEFILEMIERGLDFPGVSFSFIGVGEPEESARPSLRRVF